MNEHSLVVCGATDEVARQLQARGHRVETADDAYRTIELVERLHPRAVMIPLSANGPAPAELVERIRQIEPSCSVLLIVDEVDPERDAELIAAGARGVLLGVPDAAFIDHAMDRVASGGLVLDPMVAAGLGQALVDSVTQRGEWARQLAERTRQAEELARAKSD